MLACASGATGSVVLWGIDKDAGVGSTRSSTNNQSCSVAINSEASASGGHWTHVTTLSISSDTLLSGSQDGMVLLWFLCRVPRSKRPAVSSRPYHLLRGHRGPVLVSGMSHAVGIAVTSSSPCEVLLHRLPRPPPLGPGFQPATEYPHIVLDLSSYSPFVTPVSTSPPKEKEEKEEKEEKGWEGEILVPPNEGDTLPSSSSSSSSSVLDYRKYVVTLCAICSSGEVVVHLHHVKYMQQEREQARHTDTSINSDLLQLNLGAPAAATTAATAADTAAPIFILMSFNVNGILNSFWQGPTANDVNPSLLCDAPLLAMEASRRSPIIIGGTSNGLVLFWHARDLVLLSFYSTGGFAVHSLSLCPSEEFVAVGCDAGVLVTIALPNCRDGGDSSVVNSGSGGGISGRVESVKKKMNGAARAVTKNVGAVAGAVAGSAVNVGKRLFAGLWGKKR